MVKFLNAVFDFKHNPVTVFLVIIAASFFPVLSTGQPGYCESESAANSNELAVFDFNDLHGFPEQKLGQGVADILSETLTKSKKFEVRDRKKLMLDFKKEHIHYLLPHRGSEALEIARKLKLKYIVTGKILKFENLYEENKKWFGSRNAEFFISIQYSVWNVANGKNILSNRMDDIIKKRVVKMPDMDDNETSKPFWETLLFPTIAKIAIDINNVVE